MGLDGIFLASLAVEIGNFVGARVEKIVQLSGYEVVVVLKKFKEVKNLLISISCNSPKIYFTKNVLKVDGKKFAFETLLKSRLKSARFVGVTQLGLDRVLHLEFKTKDEIGQEREFILSVEFFSRYSNVILFDKNTLRIEDSLKRVSIDSFQDRPVLPKLELAPLKKQQKINILEFETLDIVKKILETKNKNLKEALIACLQGIGGFVAEILSFKLKKKSVENFDADEKALLFDIISFLKNMLKEENFEFVAVLKDGRLEDFTFFDISKFVDCFSVKKFETSGELLDFFYEEKDFYERQMRKTNSIVKFLKGEISKAKNKIKARKKDLKDAQEKKDFKKFGDLLSVNIAKIKKGQTSVVVENFYEGGKEICLDLNPKYSGSQNVQFYYKSYKKAKTAKEKLKDLIEKACEELQFLQEEFGFVKRCTTYEDLLEIVEELEEQNYNFSSNKKIGKKQRQKKGLENENFLRFKSSEGFYFYCGKNSRQNELLTVKKAKKHDVWFHVSEFSGSHVVVFTNGKKIDERTIKEAATVAAYYSELREEKKVDVWYTLVLNIKKDKNTKPGMVNFKDVKKITILNDFELVNSLKQ